jgi:hypothetical protein
MRMQITVVDDTHTDVSQTVACQHTYAYAYVSIRMRMQLTVVDDTHTDVSQAVLPAYVCVCIRQHTYAYAAHRRRRHPHRRLAGSAPKARAGGVS